MLNGVVLLSGGIDSAVTAWMMRGECIHLHALSFRYGQRHADKELACAKELARQLGVVNHKILDVPIKDIGGSALTDDRRDIPVESLKDVIPDTWVPQRNTIFLAFAFGWAEVVGADSVWIGANAVDYCMPGYTDVIAREGVVKLRDLEVGREVLSFDLASREMCFKPIVRYEQTPRQDKLLRFTLEGGSQFECTLKHHVVRVWTHSIGSYGIAKLPEIVEAEQLAVGDYTLLPFGSVLPDDNIEESVDLLDFMKDLQAPFECAGDHVWFKSTNMVKRYVSREAFMKLCGWYISEGGVDSKGKGFGVTFYQSEKNKENCDDILATLAQWGFKPSISRSGPEDRDRDLAIHVSGPTTHVLKLFGVHSKQKTLGNLLCGGFGRHSLSVLLGTLISGDGSAAGGSGIEYYTASAQLAQEVGALATLLGYRTVVGDNQPGLRCVHMYKSELHPSQRKVGQSALVKVKQVETIACPDELFELTVEDTHTLVAGTRGFAIVSQSGYPDCRPVFLQQVEKAFNLASKQYIEERGKITLKTPVLRWSKAAEVVWGLQHGVPFASTWSCYRGGEKACGVCDSCRIRLQAFEAAGVIDPIQYERL